MKTHWHLGPFGANKTACGISAYPEKNSDVEYSTVRGGRIECATEERYITCIRCRKAALPRSHR